MSLKTAYFWGPISCFSGSLVSWLLQKGWHVHVATKPALNLFSLSPLDLRSTAAATLSRTMDGADQLKTFQDRLRFIEPSEAVRHRYNAAIFCGLPPNFDEPRTPRAPWAATELPALSRTLKGVPIHIFSSLWGGIQTDRVVPEELEFERRKPTCHWESICQQYEIKLLKALSHVESPWYLTRLPLITGDLPNGRSLNFTGLFHLLREAASAGESATDSRSSLSLIHQPNSTLWFLPVDNAVYISWRLLEDAQRPRICNLVPTHSVLNREWLNSLALACGFANAQASSEDSLNLPHTLRCMLNDDISVKNRNLFEAAGKYQLQPTKLGVDYFERWLKFARSEQWGKSYPTTEPQFDFSLETAQSYFQDFLPSRLSPKHLQELTAHDTAVGFMINGWGKAAWLLKAIDGTPVLQPLDPEKEHPRVILHIAPNILPQLLQARLSLHEALLRQQVRMEGYILDALRVSGALSQFFKQHPYTPESMNPVITEAT